MGDFNFWITDDLDQQFRWTVFHIKGSKKGNLQDSYEEAVKDFIKKYERLVPTMPPKIKQGEDHTWPPSS